MPTPETDGPGTPFPFLPPEKIRRAAIICHRHADPDAYLSAYAISRILRKISPSSKIDIVLPDGLSTLTRKLAETYVHESLVTGDDGGTDAEDYDLLVAIDIGHTELLKDWQGKLQRSKGLKVLVDHHPIQENSVYDHMVVDTTASSAAEIVATLSRQLGIELDQKTAQALLVAILFDSQHLAIAKEKTLREVVLLLDRGAVLDDAKRSLRSPPDYGEVIAKLKSAKRAKVYRVGGWVVVASTVGSFQANVARAFVSMGADVAIVTGESGGETRGSLRAHQRFWEATNIHLGTEIAGAVAKEKGYGGGHPTAASFTCSLPEEEALEAALSLLSTLLKDKPVEIR
jgi:phosphoesterase RecJ-like protein